MINQIDEIKIFIHDDTKNLIINQINDEIGFFYKFVLSKFAEDENLTITICDHLDEKINNIDLFGTRNLKVYSTTSSKKIHEILNQEDKKVIFTDYKNFKKYSPGLKSINGYQFEKDINTFMVNELNIDNSDLINYVNNNPSLIFSETSKYSTNNRNYIIDKGLEERTNHILEIRKSIFEIKKTNLNIIKIFSKIKDEAKYKKLSFLTF